MYLCRILTNESFPKIGDAFGKRDHTTVMHAYKKIEQEMKIEAQNRSFGSGRVGVNFSEREKFFR